MPGSGAPGSRRTWMKPSPSTGKPSPPSRSATRTGPGRLSSLGNVLQARFGRTGQLADLDEAITLFRDAVNVAPADQPAGQCT